MSYYVDLINKEDDSPQRSEALANAAALSAAGSVRDGLSYIQRFIAEEGPVVDNTKDYFSLVSAIYQGDATTSLAILKEIRKVEDARLIIQTLEGWFYHCSLESFGMRTPVRDYFEGEELTFDLKHLQTLFNTCLDIERNFTATPNSKIVVEMGILKLCL